ncbi:MAG: hypothetical protein JST73_13240 [Actinobacteria bacterium]|nr:hypothetical protein [Actinomycetota bacterium]
MSDQEHEPEVDVPEPRTVRRIHRVIEPLHAIVYFAPQRDEIYARLGLDAAAGYFASRSAALGPVPSGVVAATFYNFSPRLVEHAMRDAWSTTTPAGVLEARRDVADTALRSFLGDDVVASGDMARAATLAREAATEAMSYPEGRALFAAHAALDWPDDSHLVLWHAVTLLREFRGDAHVATLLTAGLDGLDAIAIAAAAHQIPEGFLRATRGWSDAEWARTVELHRSTGWIAKDDGPDGTPVLTDEGAERREQIEAATDRASTLPWLAIGSDGIAELHTLVRPWARTLADAMFSQFTS